jgi:competence protein ComGC
MSGDVGSIRGAPMFKPRFPKTLLTASACALLALPAAADSQARIVRLSDVQGGVQINKNAGLGFENAFLNLPVTQGTQLRTGEKGRAEIEFEDGSTLRLTPNTQVEMSTLGSSDGKRISTVNLLAGRAYVNWLGKAGDQFTLKFSGERVMLSQAAHFRVVSAPGMTEVASFKNDLEVTGQSATVKVPKKKMVDFDADHNDQATEAKNLKQDTYDDWDKQSVSYHDEYAKNNSTPLGYGASDLSYYGGYSNLAGYGNLWQPYFAGAGWNPYMDGAWSFYPGMGYMWASAYPWGWMPYYYGNWVYAPGFGWGWQPGGFNSWQGGVRYTGALAGFRPPVAPTGTVNTVVVGKGGPVVGAGAPTRMMLSGGSAGLGIARGSVIGLRELNSQVAKTGSVELHPAAQFSAVGSRPGAYMGGGEREGLPAGSAGRASAAPVGHAGAGNPSAHR